MPKKAKRGGGAGGGRTEEERLLLLQHRAQAEEEVAKKKEEILTLFLKDKLQKEERNTAVNLLKLSDGWRSILRRTRGGELHRDLTLLSQTFERQLDGLDAVVKSLARDLQEAELQAAQVQRVHLQQVERLWAQQNRRLASVQQRCEDDLTLLSAGFSEERAQASCRSGQQRADLEDAMFTAEQQHKTVMDELHRLYSESIAACESAHQDRKAVLVQENKDRLKLETQQKEATAQLCSEETDELSNLLQKTQDAEEKTDAAVQRVKKLQDAVLRLRAAPASSQTEGALKEHDLTAAGNQLNRRTQELRDQLTQARTAARKQLTELTVQSAGAAKKLQAAIAKGQEVLRVAEMCQKLQSEQQEVSSEELRQEGNGAETKEPEKDMSVLQQVKRSLNSSVLRREAVRGERDELRRENRQLKLLLRQHLDAMTVSELDERHALLTMSRAPTTTGPPDTDRRHTVIEAAHAVKHLL